MSNVTQRPTPAQTVTINKYLWRGFQYAAISACTIIAGYLMQSQKVQINDLLLLSIPIFASGYFFIRYANRFHPTDSSAAPSDVLGTAFQTAAVRVYFSFVLIPYSIFILFIVSRTEALSYRLVFSLFLYVSLFIYYSRFLINYKSNGHLPLIRHWLIWPVILSIALGLFYGLSFSDMKESLLPLASVGIIIFLYIATQILRLSRRLYLLITLLVILATTTFSLLDQIGYLPLPKQLNLSTLLFCVAASAYLAVFEAGRITSDIAKEEQATVSISDLEQQELMQGTKSFRYAQATLAAITATVGVLPFYYIFSNYGSLFLIGFAIHAFTSFIFWYYFGQAPYLQKWSWAPIKIIAGVFFLLLLVFAPTNVFSEQFTFIFMKGFAGWVGIPILMVLVGFMLGKLLKDFEKIRDEGVESPGYKLFKDRINYIRMLGLLCLIFCLIITGLLVSKEESSLQRTRAELAFQVYAICIFLCSLVDLVDRIRKKPKMSQTIKPVIGILLVIRVFTSLIIAFVVVLPLFNAGVGFIQSLLSALPFFFAAAGGFALNDYSDVSKDVINKPYRALPSGKIRPKVALWIGIILIGVSFLLSILAYNNTVELFLYLGSIVGVLTYNFFVRHLALSKTFLTAAVSTLPLLYVVITLSYPSIYFLIPIGSMIFLLGRELLMDIRDIKGDSASGIRTLPMIIGADVTARIGFLLLLSCSVILLSFSVIVGSVQNFILSGVILIISLLMSQLWAYKAGKYQRSVIISLYLPMLCGIIMLVR